MGIGAPLRRRRAQKLSAPAGTGNFDANPKITALLCGNDNMAIGAVSAIKAAGKLGKVKVIGYDNINAIKPMLKDGRVLATADQFASQQAVFGIETVLKALTDKKKQSSLSGAVETKVQLVTKDSK